MSCVTIRVLLDPLAIVRSPAAIVNVVVALVVNSSQLTPLQTVLCEVMGISTAPTNSFQPLNRPGNDPPVCLFPSATCVTRISSPDASRIRLKLLKSSAPEATSWASGSDETLTLSLGSLIVTIGFETVEGDLSACNPDVSPTMLAASGYTVT